MVGIKPLLAMRDREVMISGEMSKCQAPSLSPKLRKIHGAGITCLAIAALIVIGSVNIVVAQEITEQEKQLAMTQYTVPYRFDKALKVGNWVKYQIVREGEEPQEMELKVTTKEGRGVWIVEKVAGNEFHLLVDLNKMKLLKCFRIDEKGEKESVTPLGDEELAKIIEMGKKQMEKEMTDIIGWEKGAGKEKVVAAGSIFECSYLEPKFSEEYIERIEDYGTTVIEVKEKSRLYFSKDIPRLLPMQIAFGWMPFIETFEEVKGGFVKSAQMNLELVGYREQEE